MDRQRLDAAAAAGIITPDQAVRLAAFFAQDSAEPFEAPTRFDVSHLLWYAGALIVIGAMTIFSAIALRTGAQALTWTAIAYAVGFVVVGRYLWNRPGLRIPGGLLIACAVAMAPLTIYGIQGSFGVWPDLSNSHADYQSFFGWLNASWVYMSLGAILAGIVALVFFPFPFIVVIIAVAAWVLAVDLVPWLLPDHSGNDPELQATVWFGLAAIVLAWLLDLRTWRAGDIPFWLHIVGIAAFWGGITAQDSNDEIMRALYALLNVGLLVLAVYLMRRVYAAFGALGVSLYLGHLAADVFEQSYLFPLALSAMGLAVIGVGIWYFRKREAIARWITRTLPPALQRLRPVHAREAI